MLLHPALGNRRIESLFLIECWFGVSSCRWRRKASCRGREPAAPLDPDCGKISLYAEGGFGSRRPGRKLRGRPCSCSTLARASQAASLRSPRSDTMQHSRIAAARQLTPFSVPRPEVSMPTLGSGYLTRFVTVVARSGHRSDEDFCVMRHSSCKPDEARIAIVPVSPRSRRRVRARRP